MIRSLSTHRIPFNLEYYEDTIPLRMLQQKVMVLRVLVENSTNSLLSVRNGTPDVKNLIQVFEIS